MADKKEFKAESKRLMDLMINSIYTNKEIFLRELISNASDAIDKLYYQGVEGMNRDDFSIRIELDADERTISIVDNGIGMTKDELENNLGTIAESGSFNFKKELAQDKEKSDAVDIIGQFGVGFYSAFMVADKVTVISRKYGEEECWQWESEGADGYTIAESAMIGHGTRIILQLKANTADDNYDEYLYDYRIKSLVKKYSDYIRYPIKMEVEKSRKKEDGENNEFETYTEVETLNSMIPIWKRKKSELTDDDYNRFFRDKFYGTEDPAKVIHSSVEGAATFDALVYIPARPPFNYFTPDYEKGLQLYSSGVLIMEHCADLVPDYFGFVRGLVDSQDLSLNISREMLQHDRQLRIIAKNLEKKIKNELQGMLNTERDKYEEFYKNFGVSFKIGIHNTFGQQTELLQDLLLYYSSSEKKMVTLAEYVSRMKEGQDFILYATGKSYDQIEKLPQIEALLDKGYEILYMIDDVDEFAVKMMRKFQEKDFKSAVDDDLGLEEEQEKVKEVEKKSEENKDLLAYMKEVLGDKVKDVRLSTRLKSSAVCLAVDGDVSLEMEKVFSMMPMQEKVTAVKILEVNSDHQSFKAMEDAFAAGNKDKVALYTDLLYEQAVLIAGMNIADPVDFANKISSLLV